MTREQAIECMARSMAERENDYEGDELQWGCWLPDATAAYDALTAAGMAVVPVEKLAKWRDREYNPFDPDNQSSLYRELRALIAAA